MGICVALTIAHSVKNAMSATIGGEEKPVILG